MLYTKGDRVAVEGLAAIYRDEKEGRGTVWKVSSDGRIDVKMDSGRWVACRETNLCYLNGVSP